MVKKKTEDGGNANFDIDVSFPKFLKAVE